MDLHRIEAVARPRSRSQLEFFREGDAWLAGGTWLFSEPQPNLRRLIDLSKLGWTPLVVDEIGLSISATCPVRTLGAFNPPTQWTAAWIIRQCCQSFAASFKILNAATVGGNICLGLPAGPIISLCAALDGACVIWTPTGGERTLSIMDFIVGPGSNALRPGELLRSVELPVEALERRVAFRRASLTNLGRSGVLLIGSTGSNGFSLTVTASTRRPVRLDFPAPPKWRDLADSLDAAIPVDCYHDDIHGRPDWRRHMTHVFAEEINRELGDAGA